MHEYSIVQSLLGLCEENAKKHKATKVNKVTIKIGKLSGVEPQLLETAFEAFKCDGVCQEAQLEMILQDLVIECLECGQTSVITDNELFCHSCKSTKANIIDGKEMYLMQLELE